MKPKDDGTGWGSGKGPNHQARPGGGAKIGRPLGVKDKQSRGSPRSTPKQKKALSDLCKEYTEEAIKTMVEIMRDRDNMPATRLTAANMLLDRAYGRPAQAIQHQTEDGAPLFTFLQQLARDDLAEDGLVPELEFKPEDELPN